MNPKHDGIKIPRNYDVYARAPYNFVRLPEQIVVAEGVPPDHDRYLADRNTGWIDCELITMSLLYIRGMLTQPTFEAVGDKPFHELDDMQKQERAKFFMIKDGQPVIPGSGLRGMIRSLVEVVSYGKVQPVTGQTLVYRAVGDTTSLGETYRKNLLYELAEKTYRFIAKAGYVRKDGQQWYIAPAQPTDDGVPFSRVEQSLLERKSNFRNWHGLRNAKTVYFKPAKLQIHPHNKDRHNKPRVYLEYALIDQVESTTYDIEQGLVEGVWVQTGSAPRKHMDFIFGLPERDKSKWLILGDDIVERYVEQVTEGQQKLLGKSAALTDWCPIFYITDDKGNVSFLGHACMFRIPYPKSPVDFVPSDLRPKGVIDIPESMFGYIAKDTNQSSYAGRVFVGDAVLLPGQKDVLLNAEEILSPKILGSPKPTTFQHYLVQADARDKRNLKHYASQTPEETVIRGHKLYWHKDNVTCESIRNDDENVNQSQLTGIKPVRADVSFCFRVHFENLNDVELGALLWALNLPEGYCQSLGMGKPLGMGAVKIKPSLHVVDRHARYRKIFEGNDWCIGETKPKNINAYMGIMEKYVLDHIASVERDVNGQVATKLYDLPRIQELMTLLSFPGPDTQWTRYMQIEHPKYGNEYKERPVLPGPLAVHTVKMPPGMPYAESPRPEYSKLTMASGKIIRKKGNPQIYICDGELKLEILRERLGKVQYNSLPGNGIKVYYWYDEENGERRVWIVQP
jgi:CRISPR-associated protein (TIGR03986 family)